MTSDADIVVAGGGIAGLTATLGFAALGFDTRCVDPTPQNNVSKDLRSTAFFMPSVTLFKRIGLWDALAPHATPLRIMRIVDAGGQTNEIREIADFDSADIGQTAFGYNIPNHVIRSVLLSALDENKNATLLSPHSVTRLLTRSEQASVTLEDRSQIKAKLVIAADGRNSFVREAAGISVHRWQFGQKALVFNVECEQPHDNISTEIHRSGGPFTLVPLPDTGGRHRCAVVWMETSAEVERLSTLPAAAFATAVNERSCGILGQLKPIGKTGVWPIIAQRADRLSAARTVLIAEAAHVIPPIGAQGLNMSLADLASLLDLAETGTPIGSEVMTTAYHRKRWAEMALRVKGIDMLNRAAMAKPQVLRDLRVTGLRTLYGITPVRRSLMKAGLGAR